MSHKDSPSHKDLVPGFTNIVMVAGYLGGRPALLGRRVSVDQILNWLGEGMTSEDILELYDIKPNVVREALIFSSIEMEKLRVAS